MRHPWIMLMLVLGCSALAARGAEGFSPADILTGKAFPLTVAVKELTPEWRRFTIDTLSGGGQAAAIMEFLQTAGMGTVVYYTRARTVEIAGETFLVAYARPRKAFDPRIFHDGLPLPEPMTPETVLTLTLLNLRMAGNLLDIRPFDAQTEVTQEEDARQIVKRARRRALQAQSMNNIRQICLAIIMYAQENNEIFLDMATPEEFKTLLEKGFVGHTQVLLHPATGQPYLPNPTLSGKRMADIEEPTKMALVFEAAPDEDGNRVVGFCDGHVEVMNETQWAEVKRYSGIP